MNGKNLPAALPGCCLPRPPPRTPPRLQLQLRLRLRHHTPIALGLREVMGVLLLTETLVVEAEAENQGVVVGSVGGEAGEGVVITEGEVGEDVESNISLYNPESKSSH